MEPHPPNQSYQAHSFPSPDKTQPYPQHSHWFSSLKNPTNVSTPSSSQNPGLTITSFGRQQTNSAGLGHRTLYCAFCIVSQAPFEPIPNASANIAANIFPTNNYTFVSSKGKGTTYNHTQKSPPFPPPSPSYARFLPGESGVFRLSSYCST